MYAVVRHDGAETFLERAEPWLLEAEDRHNLMLGLASARSAVRPPDADAFFATVETRDDVVGCVIRTPPHKVLVTELPVDAAGAVADALADLYGRIPAVLGAEAAAEAVAAAWVRRCGGRCRPGMEQRIYRLDAVVSPPAVDGVLREATHHDVDLAVEWGEGFAEDAGVQFQVERSSVERWVERRHLYIWESDGPRSITVAQGRTPNGVRVGYVYTPPDWRGRGYASACVAAVSQRMLDSGLSFCVLYTDLSNPTSNALYRRLGYRPIADVRDVDIVAEEAS